MSRPGVKAFPWSFRQLAIPFFAMLVTALHSQYSSTNFIRYTIRDGLSDNSITCLEQDNYDFIWIGTAFGLNRFDGKSFERFFQETPGNFLTSSAIRKFSKFDADRMAVITQYGLQVINTSRFTSKQYIIPDSTALVASINDFQDAIAFDNQQVGASSATGFYVFDDEGSLVFRHDAFHHSDIGHQRMLYGRGIVPGHDQTCLVYTNDTSQALYDHKRKSFTPIDQSNGVWKHFVQPHAMGWRSYTPLNDDEFMFLSRHDSIQYYNRKTRVRLGWQYPAHFKNEISWESRVFMRDDTTFLVNGAYKGIFIFHFNRQTGSIRFDPNRYLDQFKITCFFRDREDRLWIGTTDGLLRQKSIPAFTVRHHWPVHDITAIGYTDVLHYGDKLYATRFSSDTGLVIVNARTMQVEKKIGFFGPDDKWDEITGVTMLYPDTFWFATFAGLMWFSPRDESYGKVNDLLQIKDGVDYTILTARQDHREAWALRSMEGRVARFDPATRKFTPFDNTSIPPLPFHRVRRLCFDRYGDTWIGGHSLTRWNHQKAIFDTVMTAYGGPNPHEDEIKLLRADDTGSLWLHNEGSGLLQYKINEQTWTHFGVRDGFPSGIIQAMSPVIGNTVWLMFPSQIATFNIRTGTFQLFDQTDGIPSIKPAASHIPVDTTTGNMYLLYHDHVIVAPFNYQRDTMTREKIIFQKISVNDTGAYYFPETALTMGSRENNLVIYFTIVSFDDSHQAKYAYRMNNGSWTSLDDQHVLHLTNLSHGNYQLEVKAMLKSGARISNTLAFHIAPPLWKTTWFILTCCASVFAIMTLLYRQRIARVQQRAELDQLISQTEMKALHAQMNPHFIFNSLNSIREMILNNEIREASRYLGNFAQLIRLTLDQSRETFISLRHTIEYIERYIEMEKIRNPDFHFTMHIDPALEPDETVLPPLLIQPFIENAIWHGMHENRDEINILLQFIKAGDQLICIIEDDGVGINHTMRQRHGKRNGHQSVSITNIQKRIELLNRKHDIQSHLDIRDRQSTGDGTQTGTQVRISLPLEINHI